MGGSLKTPFGGGCFRDTHCQTSCSTVEIILKKKVFKSAGQDTLFSPPTSIEPVSIFEVAASNTASRQNREPPSPREAMPARETPALTLRSHLRAAARRIKKETGASAELGRELVAQRCASRDMPGRALVSLPWIGPGGMVMYPVPENSVIQILQ